MAAPMKTLLACLCISPLVFGQAGGRARALGGFPNPSRPVFVGSPVIGSPTSAPALGGLPVSNRPLGGVTQPGTRKSNRANGFGTSAYVGPIYYVPGASDYSSADFWNSTYSPAPVNAGFAVQPAAPVQPPPIIINQYFDSRRPLSPQEDVPPVVEDSSPKPGDPLSDPQNYYLIQYKDHTIYSALAYWVEGDTLHYVTTQNTHNQASLSLIDLDKTYKLNEDRSVPFSIPGR
jgi:hypothetical protein